MRFGSNFENPDSFIMSAVVTQKFADIQQVVFILRIKLQCSLKILKRRLSVTYFEFGVAPKIVP